MHSKCEFTFIQSEIIGAVVGFPLNEARAGHPESLVSSYVNYALLIDDR